MKTFIKDPDALLDYSIDWQDNDHEDGPYLEVGETITTSTWTAEAGIDISGSPTHDDTVATVWLEGGTPGEIYRVTNRIETSAGRRDDRTILIQVEER